MTHHRLSRHRSTMLPIPRPPGTAPGNTRGGIVPGSDRFTAPTSDSTG